MYIRSKPAAAFYKLFLGVLALGLTWSIFSQYGATALRLFPTWMLILAAIYYLISALMLALGLIKSSGKNPCPVCEGAVIMGFFLMGGMAIAAANRQIELTELPIWLTWLLALVLPLLTFLDWMLFCKKGRFRPMAPFYWLALPLTYMATMIFTAEVLPENSELLYPLAMFDVKAFGFWPMLGMTTIITLLVLAVGYIFYLLDFTMSGKLAKNIVLPHLRVIEVDEHGREITPEPEPIKHNFTLKAPKPAEPEISIHNPTMKVSRHAKPEAVETPVPDLDVETSEPEPTIEPEAPVSNSQKPSSSKSTVHKATSSANKKVTIVKIQNKLDSKSKNSHKQNNTKKKPKSHN